MIARTTRGLCTAALVVGCYSGAPSSGAPGGESEGSEAASDSGDSDPDDQPPGTHADELPAPSHRVARLTHAQWENTVRDLFYLDAPLGLSADFRPDVSSTELGSIRLPSGGVEGGQRVHGRDGGKLSRSPTRRPSDAT